MRSKFYMTASPRACGSISFLDFIAPYWFPGSWSFLLLRVRVSHHFHFSSDLVSLFSACWTISLRPFFKLLSLSCLFAYIFVCSHLGCSLSATSSLPFFLSLCQCFSSCQSFTLSVSPFVTRFKIIPGVRNTVRTCVRAWACFSNHYWVFMYMSGSFSSFKPRCEIFFTYEIYFSTKFSVWKQPNKRTSWWFLLP